MKKIALIICIALLALTTEASVSIQQVSNAVPGAGLTVAVNSDFSAVSGGVSAFQLDITIDAASLVFTGLQNSAFSGAQASMVNPTTIRVIWTDNLVQSQLDGKMFDLVFTYNGGDSDLSFVTANSSVVSSEALPVATNYINGSVSMTDPQASLTVGNKTSEPGQMVNIPVTANQLFDIGGISIYLNFSNPAVVSGSVTLANVNPALSGLSFGYESGEHVVTWATDFSSNVSIANGAKLFDLQFTFAGGTSEINFNTSTTKIFQNAPPFDAFTGVIYNNGSIQGPELNVKIFLEGAYDSGAGSMNTTLNSSTLIPLSSENAYAAATYNYTASTVQSIPNADIVDWVLVELRDAATAAAALSTTSLSGWPKAFFLKSDGSIVDLDGTSMPNIGNTTVTNNLYVIVRHRNHLAIMSNTGATLTGNVYSYDFTSALTQAYGGGAGYKQISGTITTYAMVTGDIDHDGNIFVSDYNAWAVQFGNTGTYLNSDLDMDGNIFVSDYNKWAVNFGNTTIDPSLLKSAKFNGKYFSCVPK